MPVSVVSILMDYNLYVATTSGENSYCGFERLNFPFQLPPCVEQEIRCLKLHRTNSIKKNI